MQKCTEELADLAIKQGLYFSLEWSLRSQMNPEQTGSNYIPSDAIAPIGEEIRALRALARKNEFDLPYAAPSRAGVLLPAIANEWTGTQHRFVDFGVEKLRFDFMTQRLSDASFDVCQHDPEDATGLTGDVGLPSRP